MKKLYGVTTAMMTPFDGNELLDLDALERETDFLIEKGVHCLYPCGTNGEMYLMSAEEREAVAETVVKRAAGRAVVYIHTGAMSEDETVRLSIHACKIGADGVGIVTPCYFKMSPRALLEYYKRVCSKLPPDFPVYVYVIPQLTGNDVPADLMEEIAAACPNVVGVKYSFPNVERAAEYTRVRGGDFSVMVGADHLFLPMLAAGCDGTITGCATVLPEIFVAIYDTFRRGDLDGARALQTEAVKVIDILKRGTDLSVFKVGQTLRGIRGGHVRRPLLDLPDDEAAELKARIAPYIEKYSA